MSTQGRSPGILAENLVPVSPGWHFEYGCEVSLLAKSLRIKTKNCDLLETMFFLPLYCCDREGTQSQQSCEGLVHLMCRGLWSEAQGPWRLSGASFSLGSGPAGLLLEVALLRESLGLAPPRAQTQQQRSPR